MAANPLSPEVLHDIADQIAASISSVRTIRAPTQLGIGESFPLVMLPMENVQGEYVPFAERIIDVHEWHHQIYSGSDAIRYARSKPIKSGGDAHRVTQVAVSTLPSGLASTITWIDTFLPNADNPKLLLCPAYQLAAIWIKVLEDDVIVISEMANTIRNLSLNAGVEADQFINRLQQNKPVEGLGRGPEPQAFPTPE